MVDVTIGGYTDAIGSANYNKKLGMKRAEYVRDILLKDGIVAERIEVISYGESQPAAPNRKNGKDNPEGRALNRRVEIILTPND